MVVALGLFLAPKQISCSTYRRFAGKWKSVNKLLPENEAASEVSHKHLRLNANAHNIADKPPLCALITTLNVSLSECAWQKGDLHVMPERHSMN